MNIYELAGLIGLDFEIRLRLNCSEPSKRWYVYCTHAEVKDGICLKSASGDGLSPDQALNKFVKNIGGKTIVINAYDEDKRIEYNIPVDLRVE